MGHMSTLVLIKHSDMLLYQNMGRERDEMMMTTHVDVMLSFISIIITIITNAATHSNMTQYDAAAVQCALHDVQPSLSRSLPDHTVSLISP